MPDITISHRHREQSTRIRCGLGPRLGRQMRSPIAHGSRKTRSSKSSSHTETSKSSYCNSTSLSPQARTRRSHKPSTSTLSIQQPTYKQQQRQQQPQWQHRPPRITEVQHGLHRQVAQAARVSVAAFSIQKHGWCDFHQRKRRRQPHPDIQRCRVCRCVPQRLSAGERHYTAASNTISGLAALASGDIVEVVVYDIFTVADTVSAKDGGTFSGNVTFSGDLR